MYKQVITRSKYENFTIEELLSIFKVEVRHICKRPDEVYSIAESVLYDFIKWHGEFVRFI